MNEPRLSKLTVHRSAVSQAYRWNLQNETRAVVALVALEADAHYIARCVNTSIDINAGDPTEDELDRAQQLGVSQGLMRAANTMLEDAKTDFALDEDAHAREKRTYAARFKAQAEAEEPKPR